MVFLYASPTEVVLQIEASIRTQADRQSRQLRHPQGRWNAYLNSLCIRTVLFWLQMDYSLTARIWLANELPELWGAVNGTAIALNQKRFVFIPSKQIDTEELTVPQEWVDLADWAGDYFLAVQIDPEGEWLRIWGYTTHAQLKANGEYQAGDRVYTLDATQLVRDVTALWVIHQLNPTEPTQAALSPAPSLSIPQIPQFQDLAFGLTPPRLMFSFPQWSAMLCHAEIRQQLYQQWSITETQSLLHSSIQLSNWLRHQFEAGWEAVETFMQPQFAYGLRDRADTDTTISRARSIAWGDGQQAILLIIVEAETTGAPKIRVRLYPGDRPLPADLSLALLTAAGEVVQWVQAEEDAQFIQLKRFISPPGKPFWIQVALDQPLFLESFVGIGE